MPFHKGHAYCANFAAHECETVYVILFWGGADEERIVKRNAQTWLSVEERQKRLYQLCNDAGKYATVIPALIDIRNLRLPDGSEDWEAETPLVRNVVGNQLDAVYSSEESYGAYFSHAYPEAVHRLVDAPRVHYPISGTAIRAMRNKEEIRKWIV